MYNYSALHSPDQMGDAYLADRIAGIVAAGAGDNTERTSQAIGVLGNNSGSASAHGVVGVRYEALEARFLCRTTLANLETLQILNLMPQHADPDGSGDPDTFADITPVDDIEVDIITLGATPKQDDRTVVSVTANVRDAITVHTAAGAVTNGLFLVRIKMVCQFSARTTAPLNALSREFFRIQYTPDLSAGATDTADVALELIAMGNTRAYKALDI